MTRSLLCLALLSLAAQAGAQVYKTVGPDGKVSYSDRPPAEAVAPAKVSIVQDGGTRPATEADLLKHAAAIPAAAAPSASQRTPEEWKAFAAAKRATAVAGVRGPAPLSSEAQARQDQIGKRLAPGLTIALNNAALVREAASLCTRAHPASAQLYRQVYRDWEDRNGAVIKRAYVLLAKYFPHTARSEADAIALRSAYDTLGVVNRGAPAQRLKWCAQTGAEMANGKIDLINTEQVAAMLVQEGL